MYKPWSNRGEPGAPCGWSYKQISKVYEAQLNKRSTGFHWNGRGAGARVCIVNQTLGQTTPYCGNIAW
ncbi:hypothetical protein OG298_03190 [Streptomyces sp. NBC_01005]|uniref:hypothetical protein n=1 Tax=unclassified Streptomyces TaxID=2593676 RepID=UPI002E30D212|nr:hypothetical protein [Streptomyces sp. NBC_01362]WSW03424.1 hypothetical protein OG298_03190 [Streptomyces sp. NBC_01005]WTC92927.1 hypothetical protein OH736_03185 [Streptomyces sp. NBC_01650]